MDNSIDFNSMEKCDVAKSLFHQINWEEMLNAGVFLSQSDVRCSSAVLLSILFCCTYFTCLYPNIYIVSNFATKPKSI